MNWITTSGIKAFILLCMILPNILSCEKKPTIPLEESKQILPTKLAFISDMDSEFRDYSLFIMDKNGEINKIAYLGGYNWDDPYPVFSPDGSKMAFAATKEYNEGHDYTQTDIFIVDIDGTNEIKLTDNPTVDGCPKFSPDGTKIAYASDRDWNVEIYIMNIDGSDNKNITNNPGVDLWHNFSPDGSKIVFTSKRSGLRYIYTMDIDGENVTLLDTFFIGSYPEYTPDGSFIVAHSGELYIMSPNGSNIRKLTKVGFYLYTGRKAYWPDGSKIVFDSGIGQKSRKDIYRVDINGQFLFNLTNDPDTDQKNPSLSPDASKIAYESAGDIFLMNSDGSNKVNLTKRVGKNEEYPIFQPVIE